MLILIQYYIFSGICKSYNNIFSDLFMPLHYIFSDPFALFLNTFSEHICVKRYTFPVYIPLTFIKGWKSSVSEPIFPPNLEINVSITLRRIPLSLR